MPMNTNKRFKRTPYTKRRKLSNYKRFLGNKRFKREGFTSDNDRTKVVRFFRQPFMPDEYFCKLVKASNIFNVNQPLVQNTTEYIQFNAPFLSDPVHDSSFPAGYSILSSAYGKVCAYAASVEMTIENLNDSASMYGVTYPSRSSGLLTSLEDASSDAKASPVVYIAGQKDGTSNIRTFTAYYTVADIWGTPKERILVDDVFNSATSSTPQNKAYFNLFLYSDSLSQTYYNVRYKITFYLKFYARVGVDI